MAGPYDYTINIPQPPAQNFLQSLLGIQQLKGLQQQSQLAEQQAAIQQQNAAFQQQMQPLERQKLEAAIAAQRASTAQSMASRDVTLEGLRQSKQTFAEQEEIKKQEKLLREDVMAIVKDPTLATQERLGDISFRTAIFAPKSYEPFQKMFEDLPRAGKVLENTASDVIFAVQSGQPKVAVTSVNKQLEAVKNSLQINPDDKEAKAALALLQPVQSLMQEGKYGEAMVSASIFLKNQNPRKWNAVTGDLKEFGGATKAVAEAEETKAKAKIEEAKLTPGGKEMSDAQQTEINKLTYASSELRNVTSAFDEQLNLILNFAEQNPKEFKTGALASIENWASGKQGVAQQAKNLRSNFQRFATEDWIKRAEPLKGGLNKEEGERLERGVPDIMTATPSELLNFGRLVSKINLLEADQKELNAAWQQNARSLQAKAPAEFEAAGITVRAGERWSEAQTRLRDSYKKKNEKQLQEDVLRLKRIQDAEKSGQSPVPNMFNLGGAPQQQQPAAAPGQVSSTPERQSLLNKYR